MAVPGKTLVEIFLNRVAKTPDLAAMRHKQDGQWKTITWRDFGDQAKEVANGLISLGVDAGDCVALLSLNRPEWHVSDAGIMLTGAKTVPIYVTSSPNQVSYIVGHSEAKVAIVENQDQLDKILKTKTEMPKLQKVVVVTGESAGEEDWIISFDELKRLGREAGKDSSALDERIASVTPDDLATIVYTSGTTGPPKGVMLTHGNFVWTLESVGKVLPFNDGADRVLSYLPLSHIFERLTSDWGGVYHGVDVWFAQSTQTLREDLADCRPTFFIGVPRVYEKFHMAMLANIEQHPKKDLVKKAI
ncbi:MAG: AMP-binding protein, partial [Actinobacteria bacterium]|nr:AMP-binding protein [Actinomycetota bacterium]